MKKIALLALLGLGLVQTLDLRTEEKELQLLRSIGLNVDTTSEEFQSNLQSISVPLVVNPTADDEPPTFAVAITRNNTLIGSGAAISRNFILTVCTLLIPKEKADTDLTDSMEIHSLCIGYRCQYNQHRNMKLGTSSVSRLIPHPECIDYNHIDPVFNIGLIEIKLSIFYNPIYYLKYAILPTGHIPEEEARFILSNFRINNPIALNITEAIWYVFTKPSPNSLCQELFRYDKQDYNAQGNICMSYVHIGDGDFCRGDVGAPLSMRRRNHEDADILIGLNIHKHQCGQPREIAAFVCVRTHKDWIESIIGETPSIMF